MKPAMWDGIHKVIYIFSRFCLKGSPMPSYIIMVPGEYLQLDLLEFTCKVAA